MQPPRSVIISIPGSSKTWTWKQSPTLAPKITEKSQKGAQSGSQETPKMTRNSIKMDTWTSKCLLGVPVDPWITKMVTQGTQNGAKVSKMIILAIKSDLAQQPTSQQFPAAKGAGGRGEAYKYIYIYIYIYIY